MSLAAPTEGKPSIEGDEQTPWTADKVLPLRLAQLEQAIVVIEMLVETIEGKFKLNQNKTDADHVAVASRLSARDDPAAQLIAARMVALRSHLMYQNPASRPAALSG